MKEASGELSMTAVAVVAIAAVGVVFTTLIWPAMKKNIQNNTNCSAAYGCTCTEGAKTCTCEYLDENGTATEIKCPKPKVND